MKKPILSTGLCVALLLLAGGLWGTTGLFVRHLGAAGLSSMTIVVIRSVLTVLMVTLGTVCIDRRLLRVRLRDIWCFFGTGIVSMMLFNVCYFTNIEQSSMAVAATMLYTAPAFVLVLSALLFRERITVRKIAALGLCVVGCVFVSGIVAGGGSLTPHSFLLGIGSGLGYGLYSIFTRYAIQRGYHTATITVYTFLFSSLGGLFLLDYREVAAVSVSGGAALWLLLAFYAVVTTVIPYLVYNVGLLRVENSKASVIASIEPVVAAMLGYAVYGEVPAWPQAIGIVLVLTAVVLMNLPKKST